mmetsp:Transcript_33224/g.95564  ORF Transcript_33224/g.95564 Transcript_33224/m.95564 type:complete len:250 (+) Transcript_33224:139-888(+)
MGTERSVRHTMTGSPCCPSASWPAVPLRVLVVSSPKGSSRDVQTLTFSKTLTPLPGPDRGSSPSKPRSANCTAERLAVPRGPNSLSLTVNTSMSAAEQSEKVASWFHDLPGIPSMMTVEKVQSGLPGTSTTQQGSDLVRALFSPPSRRRLTTATWKDRLPPSSSLPFSSASSQRPVHSNCSAGSSFRMVSKGGGGGSSCSAQGPSFAEGGGSRNGMDWDGAWVVLLAHPMALRGCGAGPLDAAALGLEP